MVVAYSRCVCVCVCIIHTERMPRYSGHRSRAPDHLWTSVGCFSPAYSLLSGEVCEGVVYGCTCIHYADAERCAACQGRLVPVPHRARDASWALGVQVAPEAHGACGQVFGMGGGMALRALVDGSNVVSTAPEASPCLPLSWRESMALNLVGNFIPQNPLCSHLQTRSRIF